MFYSKKNDEKLKCEFDMPKEIKVRDSNVELLRLVAMFFVLVLHANLILNLPTTQSIIAFPRQEFIKAVVEAFAIVAVNVFVLISGWFGLRFRVRGLLSFLFQVFFFSFGVYAIFLVLGNPFEKGDIAHCLLSRHENYWFAKAYLVLLVFAPVLNAFIEKASKKLFAGIILLMLLFHFFWDWCFGYATPYFEGGYSPIWFMTLYLTGRYCNIYKPYITKLMRPSYVSVYAVCSIIIALSMFLPAFLYGENQNGIVCHVLKKLGSIAYDSPLVFISALSLLLFFTKLKFYSRIINWSASSAFAVYLLQTHFCVSRLIFAPCVKSSYCSEMNWLGVLCVIGFFFVVGILIDKIRLFLWEALYERLPHHDEFEKIL